MTSADGADAPEDARAEAIRRVEGEFVSMVGRFRRLIARRAERLSPGLLPGGFKVFTTIALGGPVKASDIAEQMLLDKSQMSRIVATLEDRGLVRRSPDPNDRRAQLLEATPEARAKLEEIHQDPEERSLRNRLDEWQVADIERLADLLHALNDDTPGEAGAADR